MFEELELLLEKSGALGEEFTRLGAQRVEAISALASSYIQLAYTMLDLARTTEIEATRGRCLTRTRRICERVARWIDHYGLYAMRCELERLNRCLGRSAHKPDDVQTSANPTAKSDTVR